MVRDDLIIVADDEQQLQYWQYAPKTGAYTRLFESDLMQPFRRLLLLLPAAQCGYTDVAVPITIRGQQLQRALPLLAQDALLSEPEQLQFCAQRGEADVLHIAWIAKTALADWRQCLAHIQAQMYQALPVFWILAPGETIEQAAPRLPHKALNFFSGECYWRCVRQGINWWSGLPYGVVAALLWSVGILSLEHQLLTHRIASQNAAITGIYQQFFPQATAVVAPKIRIQRKLQGLAQQQQISQAIQLLGRLNRYLAGTQQLQMQQCDFSANGLSCDFTATNESDIRLLRQRMTVLGTGSGLTQLTPQHYRLNLK